MTDHHKAAYEKMISDAPTVTDVIRRLSEYPPDMKVIGGAEGICVPLEIEMDTTGKAVVLGGN